MGRYTADVLNVMGGVGLPDPTIGSNSATSQVWGIDLNLLLLNLDAEFALSYAGDPNGNVASNYVGRKLYDSVGKKTWVCVILGSAGVAVWEDVSGRKVRIVTGAGAVSMTAQDCIVELNKGTPAATVINLPSSPIIGKPYTIKDGGFNCSTYPMTLTPASGNIDDGSGSTASTHVMNQNGASRTLYWNGTNWRITA